MDKSINRAKKAAEALSQVRSLRINFKGYELKAALKAAKFPYLSESISLLKTLGIIAKDKDGYYFTSKEPVHFSKLREPLDKICKSHGVKLAPSYQAKPCIPNLKDEIISAYTVTINSDLYVVTSKEALLRLIEKYDEILISKAKLYE
jgi:hypothetical protein